MIQIQQLKLPITHTREDLERKVQKVLKIQKEQLLSFRIARQSLDARNKKDILYVYTIEADTDNDEKYVRRLHQNNICLFKDKQYQFPLSGSKKLSKRPVIVGSGPAGLFCAYMLAAHGYAPIVLERGRTMEKRQADVNKFWTDGKLDTHSNVQFGEGGAGTFSDGKLNTLVKDRFGRNRKVLEIFTAHGAPEAICYEAKPHIGTDVLAKVIPSIRQEIILNGGTFLFENCLTDFKIKNQSITAVELNHDTWIDTQVVVLAIGHSARDTFELLHNHGIPMEAKSFAVGLRVEHLQEMINKTQYGEAYTLLSAASYKVTANVLGRGVYSFCMCPGGYVVNASSEDMRLAVNGMSYHDRNSANANSAVIVSVTPKDFGEEGPLSGVAFQRKLEEKAFVLGKGAIPQQLFGDFKRQKMSRSYGSVPSLTCGRAEFGALHTLFTKDIYEAFLGGMEQFAKNISNFNADSTVLSGVESRTSSPVRILRNETLQSGISGLYPCGEGAGYAGGIMSAAMDGIKTAEAIASLYLPYEA